MFFAAVGANDEYRGGYCDNTALSSLGTAGWAPIAQEDTLTNYDF